MSTQNQPPATPSFNAAVPNALDQLKNMTDAGQRVHGSVNDLFARLKDTLLATQHENEALRAKLEKVTDERDRFQGQNDVLLGENQSLYRDLRALTESIAAASFEIGKGDEIFGDLNAQLNNLAEMIDAPSVAVQSPENIVSLDRSGRTDEDSAETVSVPGQYSGGGFQPSSQAAS